MGYFTTLPHSAPTDTLFSAQTICAPFLDAFSVLFNTIVSYSLHSENFWTHFFQTIEASAKKSKALLWVNKNWFAYQSCWSTMYSWSKCVITSIKSPFWGKKNPKLIFTLSNKIYQPHNMGWRSVSWCSTSSVPQALKIWECRQFVITLDWICQERRIILPFFLSFLSQTDRTEKFGPVLPRLNRRRWCLERCDFTWKFELCFVALTHFQASLKEDE